MDVGVLVLGHYAEPTEIPAKEDKGQDCSALWFCLAAGEIKQRFRETRHERLISTYVDGGSSFFNCSSEVEHITNRYAGKQK